jgi:adenosylcobyric acid synthase
LNWRGGVLVVGTSSGAGKSFVVTGLCRLLAREGVRVAPFKAQNMSNQSAVTIDDGEIGRAQWAQAVAAGVEPETAMNPVLLKPEGETGCQVVVRGRVAGRSTAHEWGTRAPELRPIVLGALAELRARFDVVVAEGAGGAAEINLLDRDIVNLPLAATAGLPAILVADIDRGGMFASVSGTFTLLPPALRATLRGIVVNRFRGDEAVLGPGLRDLEARTGVPVLGVVPYVDAGAVDVEDGLDLAGLEGGDGPIDVAVIALPRAANLTDVEPLRAEPSVSLRLVRSAAGLDRPDLVVLPGTKATTVDLDWLRATGLAAAIDRSGATVLGICGGYQMLGRSIDDAVESGAGWITGLGHLPVTTAFATDKIVRRRRGRALGATVDGYEIHHGRVQIDHPGGWVELDDDHGHEQEGTRDASGRWWGTSVHGLFESDGFRRAFLAVVADRAGVAYEPGTARWVDVRAAHHDRIADVLASHLDLARLREIVRSAELVTA